MLALSLAAAGGRKFMMEPSVGVRLFRRVSPQLPFITPVFASIYQPVTEPVTCISKRGDWTHSGRQTRMR
ncbi:hypothetical protein AS031_13795 [Pseudarthrobacter enclensis]|uniref:Uncharacterized protein n=1 Tax=Pseudarthrobacter enclensis TaxID=993070 RepID=A0A0V8IJY1_9MICC|nr:hypothetical protein AS031_13795 [Pseudarthrobacter enclensis]